MTCCPTGGTSTRAATWWRTCFLYYLLLMYAALVALRGLARPVRVLRVVQPTWWAGLASRLGDAVYARMPLLLGLVTYRYFVRHTALGTLLNGRRVASS